MEKLFLVLAFLYGCLDVCQATRPKFSVVISDDFLLVGRSVKVTQRTTVTEATPLRFKIKLPSNHTAFMRILALNVKINQTLQITGNTLPNLTSSSAKDGTYDIATINLGQVTPTGPSNDIVISFMAQLLDHDKLTNGDALWVSIGAEFTNGSVWANQAAIKCFKDINPEPVLHGETRVLQMESEEVVTSAKVDVNFRLTHDPHKTTAIASAVNITFSHPAYLTFDQLTAHSNSIDAQIDSGNSVSSKTFVKVGALGFDDVVEFNMTFNVDPAKIKPRGRIHTGHLRVEVDYSFTSPFYPSPRQQNMKRPISNKIKFYAKRDACDEPLGMVSGTITDSMIKASSYLADGAPSQSRLNGLKAWIPSTALKFGQNEFIQVDFQAVKTVHRIALKGTGTDVSSPGFVREFRLFYSEDCAVFKLYKNVDNIEDLRANKAANKTATVSLDPPINAKCVRINPRSYQGQISLRFELYGCAFAAAAADRLHSRTYLADTTTNMVYACSIPMRKRMDLNSCFASKAGEHIWIAIDRNVLNIEMFNPATKQLYGLGANNAYYVCPANANSLCSVISSAEYARVKALSGIIVAKIADKMTVTDDPNSKNPVDPDIFTLSNGEKIGASPLGIFWYDGGWKQKTSWLFSE